MHNYEKLTVWQKAMDLAEEVYRVTEEFPKTEQYGITSQMRRAAVSIPSNIAEGSCRGSEKYFQRFLQIAFGSGTGLETQIKLSKRLGYINEFQKAELILSKIMKILRALILKNKD